MNDRNREEPGPRINPTAGVIFSSACALVFMGFIAAVAFFGVPGSTGGTSDKQQQASGAPQPTNESTFGNGGTRETTGWGAPVGARPPRQ